MQNEKPIVEQLREPIFKKPMLDEGIDEEYLAKKLKEELEAEETKTFSAKGLIFYSEPLIAWPIRQRARQDAHRLRGDYPTEKTELEHTGTIVLAPKQIKKPKNSGK